MMNPSSSGWIKKFFSITGDLKKYSFPYQEEMPSEEFIYGNLQPTGLMYGFPTEFLFLPDEEAESWSSEEKIKVLLFEGLLLADFSFHGDFIFEDLDTYLERFVQFYEDTDTAKAKSSWIQFKEKDVYARLESILAQRVDIKLTLSNKLWTNYLHNSLIFQDLIFYFEYCDHDHSALLAQKRKKVMLDMIKLVAVAAHADGEITEQEKALFEIFMASAQLGSQDREIAKNFWDSKKTLAFINFDYDMSWLLKRYFLEVATLMVWSDKVVVTEEQAFLYQLGAKLHVDEEEQDKSFIAIQSFVLNNVDTIPILSGKSETDHLISSAAGKWKNILSRNKDKLYTEVRQSKELMHLIRQSTARDLTLEEKKRVKNQFKDMARTIPAFALFMLPGGTVILPLVLKLIPDLIPSAFRSNQLDDEPPSEASN